MCVVFRGVLLRFFAREFCFCCLLFIAGVVFVELAPFSRELLAGVFVFLERDPCLGGVFFVVGTLHLKASWCLEGPDSEPGVSKLAIEDLVLCSAFFFQR